MALSRLHEDIIDFHEIIGKQRAEIERLTAIIDKLPKTADGVPIVPGMIAWCHHCGITRAELIGEFGVTIEGPTVWCDGMADADGLYGTREAADAAGGE